jgi:hypothetical protein
VGALSKSLLLFALNWLDAQLTILWVRMNIATEGNGLMASLLDAGELRFLIVKLGVGAFTAYILYRCAHLPLARKGMRFVLVVYLLLLVVHTATGFSALGWHAPATVFSYLAGLPGSLLAHFS